MTDHLSGDSLLKTVRALADDIGPRPAGHVEEEQAREYVRKQLSAADITDVETIPFRTIDTWGYLTIVPVTIALMGSLLGRLKGFFGTLGKLMTGVGAIELWRGLTVRRQWIDPLYPKNPGGTVLARLQPEEAIKQRVVLIGHVDSNKHRATFSPTMKHLLQPSGSLLVLTGFLNPIAQLLGESKWARRIRLFCRLTLLYALGSFLNDEREGYVDGANDNASAVACVMGLGRHFKEHPLKNTEVWLAFTGSEEVGHDGLRAVLQKHGSTLKGAWFIDIEMVGAGTIHYVTRHSGFNPFGSYTPDPYSAVVAARVANQHPELGVTGRKMVIEEEVDTLRKNGFRGICIVGAGEDGFLANWHQYSDNSSNVKPEPLETAARFIRAMMEDIDETGGKA